MPVRKATFADEDQLLEIIAPLRGPAFNWSVDAFLSEFLSVQTYVYEDQQGIKAFVCLRDLTEAWEISVLATKKEFQGQKVMERLLKEVFNTLGQEREMWLEVHQDNLAARNLYQKLGFQNQGERKAYYSDGAAALLFTRPRGVKA